jgi:transcription elongation GreA/GreB family factor
VFDTEGDRVDRARAGLYFARWYPDRREAWIDVLRTLWDQGLSISDLTSEEEQLALLEVSHASGVESDAILSGLDSRFSAVQRAAAVYREQLDQRGGEDMRRTQLQHASRYPAAALRLIDAELARDVTPPDVWRMFAAALALIEERPKASTADKVCAGSSRGHVRPQALGHSDPAGDPAPATGAAASVAFERPLSLPRARRGGAARLGDEVETVRAARRRKSEKLFDKVGETVETHDVPMMTRATYERMQKELEHLERELRTTIPATIQKARELGDLKENAEYHSAKLKQANMSRVVASLQTAAAASRFVDEIEHKEGVIGLGTEVVLESDGAIVTYWILGEGEHHHRQPRCLVPGAGGTRADGPLDRRRGRARRR